MSELIYFWRTKIESGQKKFGRIALSELEEFKEQQAAIDDLVSALDNQTKSHNELVGRVSE